MVLTTVVVPQLPFSNCYSKRWEETKFDVKQSTSGKGNGNKQDQQAEAAVKEVSASEKHCSEQSAMRQQKWNYIESDNEVEDLATTAADVARVLTILNATISWQWQHGAIAV